MYLENRERGAACPKRGAFSAVRFLVLVVLLLCVLPAAWGSAGGISPTSLSCEYKKEPLAVDSAHPRLFWQVSGKGHGRKQTAYQILVARSAQQLARDEGDLWDSGEIASSNTIQIPYAGKPLGSFEQAFWKVRVWDEKGVVSQWSKPASWSMGLLNRADWTAHWITYPKPLPSQDMPSVGGSQWIWHASDGPVPPTGKRWFRGTLQLPADLALTSASISVSADDNYSVSVNGGPVHGGPRTTDSWRTFQSFNVLRELRPGPNTVVIQAENTTESPAGVIARLMVSTKTQTFQIATGANWESAAQASGPFSPVRVVGDLGVEPWGKIVSAASNERTPPPYFRKGFVVDRPIKRAVLYATALGVYELSLNGKRVSDDVLSPGWTDFHKRVHYMAYDVTRQVRRSENVLGAILGDGWYASYLAFTGKHHFYGGDPKLCLQLRLEYADGSTQTVQTDETWRTTYGPVKAADMLMGYEADTRREMPGWNAAPRFDDAAWKSASVQTAPELIVESQPNEPIRPTGTVRARTRKEPKKGVFLYDLRQNMVGWARVKMVKGQAGDTITVRFGERLNPDGTLYTANLRSARATDTFVLKGGTQTLEPKFTFHGFQYVEISGTVAPPSPKDVTGVVVCSDLTPTLAFQSDNPLLNRLVENIDWGFKGNSLDVPTDCPQRDERAGWTGDAQVFAKTAMFHRNAAPFFTKWLQDLEDGQTANGAYPDVAPSILGGGNAAWEDAGVVCTYRLFEMYGDTAIIEKQWPSLTRFMAHLAQTAPTGIRSPGAYGDWLLLAGPQKSPIHGTAYYFRSASLMAQMADAIGKKDEADNYRALCDKIRAIFQERFVSPEGRVAEADGKESQTFYALALEWELLPLEKRAFAAARLDALLQERGNHLATGFIGTPLLLPALTRTGQDKEASSLLLTETYPSWLYQVKIGATTMWERWDGWTPEKGFQTPVMNSFNHYWLGCVGEWMYTDLVGIDTDGPGWQKIVLRPHVDGGLQRARANYDSLCGRIESGWVKKSDGSLELSFSVPANVSATVYVPAGNAEQVTGTNQNGVSFVRQEKDATVYAVGSGHYKFVVRRP